MDNEWLTVAEAARVLNSSKQAIRQRIYRGTIEHRKDAEGTVYVHITRHNQETNAESYGETLGDMGAVSPTRELVEELRDRVSSLESQLEHERRANAEHRRLLAAALERIPAIEAPSDADTPSDEPEFSPEPYGDRRRGDAPTREYGPTSRPWWRRWFGM
jgi:hypothetical protein